MNDYPQVFCYGELLWDCFPEREILGGAPFNVAYRLHCLGVDVHLISAIGSDLRGEKALDQVKKLNLDTGLVQIHEDLPTGYVSVSLDENKSASYTIAKPVAWDRIKAPANQLPEGSILIFGSLALRETYNKQQLNALLSSATVKVFDINLRPPHYNINELLSLISICDCLKLNEEELPLVLAALQISASTMHEQLQQLSAQTHTPVICVTLGGDGAALWSDGQLDRVPGIAVEIVDTVGAGDAFLAGFVYAFYLLKYPAQKALQFGCVLGSLIASKAGATAPVEISEILSRLNH